MSTNTVLIESKTHESKGNLVKALSSIQKSIEISTDPDQIHQYAKICNKLFDSNHELKFLKLAESVLLDFINKNKAPLNEKTIRYLMLTYNNCATFYKSLRRSQNYLIKSMGLYQRFDLKDPDSLQMTTATILNVATHYIKLKKFKKAISLAENSLLLLQKELQERLNNKSLNQLNLREKRKVSTLINTYMVAFYDIGVAQESLGRHRAALIAYQNGILIGHKFPSFQNLESLNLLLEAIRDTKYAENPLLKKSKSISSQEFAEILSAHRQNVAESNDLLKSQEFGFSGEEIYSPVAIESDFGLSPINRKVEYQPERYYSNMQLKRAERKLQKKSSEFVSADDYFFSKISKTFKMNPECARIKPCSDGDIIAINKVEIHERKILSNLKVKKKHVRNTSDLMREFNAIETRIEAMKNEEFEKSKKNEVTMKSKLKTKVYKNLLKSLNSKNSRVYPNQRIFFKPPIQLSNIDWSHRRYKGSRNNPISKNPANQEIEELIDKIQCDLKTIDHARTSCKSEASSETFYQTMNSNLGQSVLQKAKRKVKPPIPELKRGLKRSQTQAILQGLASPVLKSKEA